MEEAKSKADQFDESFINLSDQLDQLDKQAKDQSVIHSEAEAVKEQLESHMVSRDRWLVSGYVSGMF